MKIIKLVLSISFFILLSCNSTFTYKILNSDYDKKIDFNNFKTYEFSTGVNEKLDISPLDQKRIFLAIETQMDAKGFSKSKNPDLLIQIGSERSEDIVKQGYTPPVGFEFMTSQTVVVPANNKIIYIDLIDASNKEFIWRGKGAINLNVDKKDALINEFISQILNQYPPIR